MALQTYNRKRNFSKTPEPKGVVEKTNQHRFVVQEHHASKLHYDFRMEMDGVLKSWSVPRGPSLDPTQKRLAVMTEDHPIKYLTFEGKIAEGNYGAGEMRIWDSGTYEPAWKEKPSKQIDEGRFGFILHGDKLKGEFVLVRMEGRGRPGDKEGRQWLLMKKEDRYAKEKDELVPILRGTTRTRPNRKARGPSVRKIAVKGEGEPVAQALRAKRPRGDVKVEVDGNVVALTSLDKVYFPEKKYTKADYFRYLMSVADALLPYLKDRPLILKRYPNGVEGKFFFQHDVDQVPDYVETYSTEAMGHKVDYVLCNNRATLLYLANMGVIPLHPWHSRVDTVERPDYFVFDLDPGDVPFRIVRQVALAVKRFLDKLGLESYPKTSGSRGMHVYVPIQNKYSYDEIADFTERVAKQIVKAHPDITTTVRALNRRPPNRIYVDHLQNAHGKTVVAAYSVRERARATVSAPLDWDEVKRNVTPRAFTIVTMPKRLKQKGDLFAEVLRNEQTLEGALKELKQLEQGKKKPARTKKPRSG